MVLLMMKSVWPLLIESALILLQTVPTHIEVDTLKKKLLVSSAKNKLEVFENDFELFKNKSEKQRP
jgi:Co/Zn/Cd efflux system component